MSQLYLRRGNSYVVTDDGSTDLHDHLPPGVFRINFDSMIGWFFDPLEPFQIPEKLYGDIQSKSDRILNTYRVRLSKGNSTGVLLNGSKGSGKTLLAKKCAMDSGLPVVVVNTPFHNDSFKEVLANIGECVIIFDEFEKVYADQAAQNAMLTLFDGVFDVRALMFLIANESRHLVGPLLNRPGRLFYALEYKGIDQEFIKEYCRDRLNNQDNLIGILSVVTMFKEFNFDQLQALVEEMNRYDEAAAECVKYLNISSGYFTEYDEYRCDVSYIASGKKMEIPRHLTRFRGHPIASRHHFYHDLIVSEAVFGKDADGDDVVLKDAEYESYSINLDDQSLVSVDPEKDQYIFESQGLRITLTKEEYSSRFQLGTTDRTYGPSYMDSQEHYNRSSNPHHMSLSDRAVDPSPPIPHGEGIAKLSEVATLKVG